MYNDIFIGDLRLWERRWHLDNIFEEIDINKPEIAVDFFESSGIKSINFETLIPNHPANGPILSVKYEDGEIITVTHEDFKEDEEVTVISELIEQLVDLTDYLASGFPYIESSISFE